MAFITAAHIGPPSQGPGHIQAVLCPERKDRKARRLRYRASSCLHLAMRAHDHRIRGLGLSSVPQRSICSASSEAPLRTNSRPERRCVASSRHRLPSWAQWLWRPTSGTSLPGQRLVACTRRFLGEDEVVEHRLEAVEGSLPARVGGNVRVFAERHEVFGASPPRIDRDVPPVEAPVDPGGELPGLFAHDYVGRLNEQVDKRLLVLGVDCGNIDQRHSLLLTGVRGGHDW